MPILSLGNRKVIFAGVASMAAICGLYKLYCYMREDDDYFQRIQWSAGRTHRRVLVLGLGSAGKTRLIRCFTTRSRPSDVAHRPVPTLGCIVENVGLCGTIFDFCEVGGSENIRYFPPGINCILWVVDSANQAVFDQSQGMLHKFLNHPETDTIPVIVVSAKQDLRDRADPLDVLKTMKIDDLRDRHRFYHIGTSVPDHGRRSGLWKLFELISSMPTTASTDFQSSPLPVQQRQEIVD